MPTIHNWSAKNLGSTGLIRGNPSERRVPSMHRLPVAACRRAKMAAIRGAAWVNSGQVVTVMTLRRVQPAAIIAVGAGSDLAGGVAGAACLCEPVTLGHTRRTARLQESGRRESNPRDQFGRRPIRVPRLPSSLSSPGSPASRRLDETQQRTPTATGWHSSASRRVGQTKTRSGTCSTRSPASTAATSRLTVFGATGRRSGRREARRRERRAQFLSCFALPSPPRDGESWRKLCRRHRR